MCLRMRGVGGDLVPPPRWAADGLGPGRTRTACFHCADLAAEDSWLGSSLFTSPIRIQQNLSSGYIYNKKNLLIFGKNSVLFTRPGLKATASGIDSRICSPPPSSSKLKRCYRRLRGGSLAPRPQRIYPIKYIYSKKKRKKEQER